MSRILLYVDEDAMQAMLVRALQARAVNVRTAFDFGMINRSDEEHLEAASDMGRVLFSHNIADFCRLHEKYANANKTHAGILLSAQQRFSVGEQMRRILHFVHHVSAKEMRSRLEFLTRW